VNPDLMVTTFPAREELNRAVAVLETISAAYERIEPSPALSLVGQPALVMSREVRGRLEAAAPTVVFSGWVDYRASSGEMPDGPTPQEPQPEDCFRRSSIMFLGPCVADETKIRLIAHLEGDLGPVLPYLNAVIPQASYTPAAETLTYMEGYRMIALYRQRITIAKADEIVDAWRTLEDIRQMAEQTWNNRNVIEPSFEIRRKPPAIEIFKRLPCTNCRICGELTCLAFAVKIWTGEASPRLCAPVFEEGGQFSYLREALLEIWAGMGIGAQTPSQ
jgi:ArsR family metal-binding transcriptional regulator